MVISQKRIESGATQAEAAKKLGVAQNTLCQYETGARRVPAALLPRMAQLYGCTIEELYGLKAQNKTAR